MDPQNPSASSHPQQNRPAPVYDTSQGGHYGQSAVALPASRITASSRFHSHQHPAQSFSLTPFAPSYCGLFISCFLP